MSAIDQAHSVLRQTRSVRQELKRQIHRRGRGTDWLSERGLTKLSGAEPKYWPDLLLKEIVDDALDAAEGVRRPPIVSVTVERDALVVEDTGPGIEERIIRDIADPNVYSSDKDLYISPSRGMIGQGLKFAWAMPFVARGGAGRAEIETRGQRWVLAADPITRQVSADGAGPGIAKGTRIKIVWPGITDFGGLGARPDPGALLKAARRLLAGYAMVNPHAAITLRQGPRRILACGPSNPYWRKWRPCYRTPIGWYTVEELHTLLRGYLEEGRGHQPLREVIGEFRGLRQNANQRAVLDNLGLPWSTPLRALIGPGGGVPLRTAAALHAAMKLCSRRKGSDNLLVTPRDLGVIGFTHMAKRLVDLGCAASSIRGTKHPVIGYTKDDLPYCVEAVCGRFADTTRCREILTATNFSPLLETDTTQHPYRVTSALADNYVEAGSPLMIVVSTTYPRAIPADSGKAENVLPDEVRDAQTRAVLRATDDWAKMQREKLRGQRADQRRLDKYARIALVHEPTVIQVCYEAIPVVYVAMAGSLNRANARQMYYGCRPIYLDEIKQWRKAHGDGREPVFCTDSYFTQTILPGYTAKHPGEMYICYDDRGHVLLPDGRIVGLGTLPIDQHIEQWGNGMPPLDAEALFADLRLIDTDDPLLTILAAISIEKEGWLGHFEAARTAQRSNVAIISAKGIPPTAARTLVRAYSRLGIPTGAFHDLDQQGFTHVHTLKSSNDRFDWQGVTPLVQDLGLRRTDVRVPVEQWEPLPWPRRQKKDPRYLLRSYGLTKEEQKILSGVKSLVPLGDWKKHRPCTGHRIELNHFTSDEFIAFAEAGIVKLTGGGKLIPGHDVLLEGLRRAAAERAARIVAVAKYQAAYEAAAALDPLDLEGQVRREITGTDLDWQAALRRIAARADGDPL
jgi:hypothetical protein